ncbi:MAG: hypothetical protein JNK82_25210 [Myxococcaceae bacterium]|nr:hypothetical protein [Myxococcaceae bacterium]
MFAELLVAVALTSNPYLDEARGLLESMQYAQARAKLEYARKVTTSTRDEKREVFALLARAWAAEGKLDQAEATFAELLVEDPSAPPPRDAPKIREAFRRAKEKLYPLDFVSLTQSPAPVGRVALQLKDPWGVVEQVALLESTDQQTFTARPLELGEDRTAAAALTPPAPGEPTRWYAEARGNKKVLASLGTAAQPFVFAIGEGSVVTEGRRTRVVPWLVAAFAVAAAAAGAALMVAGWSDSDAAGRLAASGGSNGEIRRLDSRARTEVTVGWAGAGTALALGVTAAVLFVAW